MSATAPVIFSHIHPNPVFINSLVRSRRSAMVHQAIIDHISLGYDIPPHLLSIEKSDNGKPFIYFQKDEDKKRLSQCHISISHAENLSVWTTSRSPISIDIEHIRRRHRLSSLIKKILTCIDFCSPLTLASSYTLLHAQKQTLTEDQQLLCFYKLWTFTEAWCKWHDRTLWQTFQNQIPFPWLSLYDLLSCESTRSIPQVLLSYHSFSGRHLVCQLSALG